jgi:hypothetical protein
MGTSHVLASVPAARDVENPVMGFLMKINTEHQTWWN